MKMAIGGKIKALRLASDLTQEELANRARLTRGFISQLENDQTSINLDSLGDILEALGVSLGEFFADTKTPQVVFGPRERIDMNGQGASKFELLVPGSTNKIMNPILIKLRPGEKLEELEPMPGEQFGFVLKGILTLIVKETEHTVPDKHCFYYKADQPHQFVNASGRVTEFLWITSPPHM